LVRGKKGLKTPGDFDLQQRGIIFNPAELTTQSMAHCQTGYKLVMISKNAFTPAYNPVEGEWPKIGESVREKINPVHGRLKNDFLYYDTGNNRF
jgi:hypothetical protein